MRKLCDALKLVLLVNDNLCGNLLSSSASAKTFDENFKVTLVPFLFQILILYVVNQTMLRLKCYIGSFYSDIILK